MRERATTPDAGHSQDGLRSTNIGETERWVSMIGGGALALLGLFRRSPAGLALALAGGYLVYRGASRYCHLYAILGINEASQGPVATAGTVLNRPIKVERSVTINKPPADIYSFWRGFENLPHFMRHLESVTTTGSSRSHWVAKAPLGMKVEWDAEITEDRENELIAWRSLENANVATTGSVRFLPAPGGRGTEVRVSLEYMPPAGVLGAAIAKLFGEEPTQQVHDDLRRFKQLLETGEVATTDGQPSGRSTKRSDGATPGPLPLSATEKRLDIVDEAAEESFPASDPPARGGHDQ